MGLYRCVIILSTLYDGSDKRAGAVLKLEIRISKSETNYKNQCPKFKTSFAGGQNLRYITTYPDYLLRGSVLLLGSWGSWVFLLCIYFGRARLGSG